MQAYIIDERMITLTKKLLAILISVVLILSCVMVPVMAAEELSWKLTENEPTIIEGEHFFNNTKVNPDPIPQNDAWSSHAGANSGYIYLNTYKDAGTYTYDLTVNAPYTGYYNLEYIANSNRYGYSKIKFVVLGNDVSSNLYADDETNTTNTGKNPYETLFDDAALDMRIYTKENVLLNEGINVISVVIYNGTTRNAWAMDYIKITPTGERVDATPFEVSSIRAEETQFSIYFNKPVLKTEENLALITVKATASSDNATITVDESNQNRVIVTCKGGRVAINIDKDFCAADGGKLDADCNDSFFISPVTPKSGSSNKISKGNSSQKDRKVYAFIGVDKKIQVPSYTTWVLALFDGDKLVAYNTKRGQNTYGGALNVIYPEGVKFTEARLFTWHEAPNEYIPVCQPDIKTAAELGFTFGE